VLTKGARSLINQGNSCWVSCWLQVRPGARVCATFVLAMCGYCPQHEFARSWHSATRTSVENHFRALANWKA
jgi:hypothetical protein